jgi:hypothetical protein
MTTVITFGANTLADSNAAYDPLHEILWLIVGSNTPAGSSLYGYNITDGLLRYNISNDMYVATLDFDPETGTESTNKFEIVLEILLIMKSQKEDSQ